MNCSYRPFLLQFSSFLNSVWLICIPAQAQNIQVLCYTLYYLRLSIHILRKRSFGVARCSHRQGLSSVSIIVSRNCSVPVQTFTKIAFCVQFIFLFVSFTICSPWFQWTRQIIFCRCINRQVYEKDSARRFKKLLVVHP